MGSECYQSQTKSGFQEPKQNKFNKHRQYDMPKQETCQEEQAGVPEL